VFYASNFQSINQSIQIIIITLQNHHSQEKK